MMEELISGKPASAIFRELQQNDKSIDAEKLGDILMDEFPEVSPVTQRCINSWFRTENRDDYPDEQLDGMILHYLKLAGYMS